jgi:hypothetical protein
MSKPKHSKKAHKYVSVTITNAVLATDLLREMKTGRVKKMSDVVTNRLLDLQAIQEQNADTE